MRKYLLTLITESARPKQVTQGMVKRAMKKTTKKNPTSGSTTTGAGTHGGHYGGTTAKSSAKSASESNFLQATSDKSAYDWKVPPRTQGYEITGTFTPQQLSEALAHVCAQANPISRLKKKEVAKKVWADIKRQRQKKVPATEVRGFVYYVEHSRGRYCTDDLQGVMDETTGRLTDATLENEFACRDVCSADYKCFYYTWSPYENSCMTFDRCAEERGGNNPRAITMAKLPIQEEAVTQPYYDLLARSAHR
jgi:hypothetical protein